MSLTFVWPVPSSKTITSEYGMRFHPVHKENRFHYGIDIGAASGESVVAVGEGTVILSEWDTSGVLGNEVQIDHGGGIVTVYGHNSKRVVEVGTKVNAGDKIAEIGTTGLSTGPHLHFEVRVDGGSKNPLDYVNTDSPVLVNDVDYNDPNTDAYSKYKGITLDGIDTSAIAGVDFSGTTVGQRVSGLSPQPLHPYVNIYVGSELRLLSSDPPKPNIVQSFEYDRLEGAGERCIMSLFDDNWDELEEIFSKNSDRIYIQYGYYGTGLKSSMVRHQLAEYSLSFNTTGTILNITSYTQGVYNNLKPMTLYLNTWNPTEAVKKICTELGCRVIDENFDESQDIVGSDPLNMIEEHPITYINEVIVPMAAVVGEELFSFHIDADNVAHFKRESYNNSRTDVARTYVYQRGYDSPVISIEFDIKGWYGGVGELEVTTSVESTILDAYTKEQESRSEDKSSVVTAATGDVTHTSADQSTARVDSSGYSASQMSSKLYHRMKNLKFDGYKCNMTIVGDPTIRLMEPIRIINLTDTGKLHHTSGVYIVIGVKDSIQGGQMTTSLELVKNATSNIDGVELLNPKYYVK